MTITPRFMWAWPSVLVEALGALILVDLVWWIPLALVRWALEIAMSLYYEHYVDAVFERKDVLQRQAALAVFEALLIWLVYHGRVW